MSERKLNVSIEKERVGQLLEDAGIWKFQYDSKWLEAGNSYPIGPGLPFQQEPIVDLATVRPVQWFFDNLLPEEALREQLARERRIDHADAFGLLEYYGAESAGAITLLPPGIEFKAGGRRALRDDELLARIRDLPQHSLESKAPKKMSLAGAQHKLPIIVDKDKYFEPEGSEPSTHILKPNHHKPDLYPHSAVNEWYTMQLASRVGLLVPATIHRYCPQVDSKLGHEAVFVIARFDRKPEAGRVRRTHSIDACQLLNMDRSFKYQSMSVETLRQVADATRTRAKTRLRLFQWCVFNAVVANADAHLKNLSFLVRREGIELAPHYDLVSTAVFDIGEEPAKWGSVPMSIQVGEAKVFRDLTRKDMLDLAEGLQIARAGAENLLNKLIKTIPEEADGLLKEFETRNWPKTAAAARGGEMKILKQVRHIPIKEMIERLAA